MTFFTEVCAFITFNNIIYFKLQKLNTIEYVNLFVYFSGMFPVNIEHLIWIYFERSIFNKKKHKSIPLNVADKRAEIFN